MSVVTDESVPTPTADEKLLGGVMKGSPRLLQSMAVRDGTQAGEIVLSRAPR